MMLKKIFNADDFGATHGVNQAIAKAYHDGVLNSTSIMIGLDFVDEALELAKQMPKLNIGLHLNLTNEYAVSDPQKLPLLTDAKGKFKHGFVNLLILSCLRPFELRKEVEIESRAQIEKARKAGIKLTHIDSHRHVHHIPLLFGVVKKLADEYKIARIRLVNENIFSTLKANRNNSYLKDGGLIKYAILRTLSWFDGLWFKYRANTYFYSILYTCKLSRDKFKQIKVPNGYQAVEVGIHPASPEIDEKYKNELFDLNVLEPWRTKELETLLDKTVVDEFTC